MISSPKSRDSPRARSPHISKRRYAIRLWVCRPGLPSLKSGCPPLGTVGWLRACLLLSHLAVLVIQQLQCLHGTVYCLSLSDIHDRHLPNTSERNSRHRLHFQVRFCQSHSYRVPAPTGSILRHLARVKF